MKLDPITLAAVGLLLTSVVHLIAVVRGFTRVETKLDGALDAIGYQRETLKEHDTRIRAVEVRTAAVPR